MKSLSKILKAYWLQETCYQRINRQFANVVTLGDFSAACQRLGHHTLSEEERDYFVMLVSKVAESEWLQLDGVKKLKELGVFFLGGFKRPSHPAYHLHRGSVSRTLFVLKSLLFFDDKKVHQLDKALSEEDLVCRPEKLLDFLTYHDDVLIGLWRDLRLKKKIPLPFHVQFSTYLSGMSDIREGREKVLLVDDAERYISVSRMTNCHAVFIFHPNSSFVYVAHVNPSQAENCHFLFGSPVSCFNQIPAFVDKVGETEGYQVIVFDKRGFFNQSAKRLKQCLSEKGVVSYKVHQVTAKNSVLGKFIKNKPEPFAIVYDVTDKHFYATYQGQTYALPYPPLEEEKASALYYSS